MLGLWRLPELPPGPARHIADVNTAIAWTGAPLARVREGAPPFFLMRGELDAITPVDDRRQFRGRVANPRQHSDIPRTGHAFDLVDPNHAWRCAVKTTDVLTAVHTRHLRRHQPTAAGLSGGLAHPNLGHVSRWRCHRAPLPDERREPSWLTTRVARQRASAASWKA
jgi:hypothetical protein